MLFDAFRQRHAAFSSYAFSDQISLLPALPPPFFSFISISHRLPASFTTVHYRPPMLLIRRLLPCCLYRYDGTMLDAFTITPSATLMPLICHDCRLPFFIFSATMPALR